MPRIITALMFALAWLLLLGMAAAPRRSKEAPTQEDWRRLLDAYELILRRV